VRVKPASGAADRSALCDAWDDHMGGRRTDRSGGVVGQPSAAWPLRHAGLGGSERSGRKHRSATTALGRSMPRIADFTSWCQRGHEWLDFRESRASKKAARTIAGKNPMA